MLGHLLSYLRNSDVDSKIIGDEDPLMMGKLS